MIFSAWQNGLVWQRHTVSGAHMSRLRQRTRAFDAERGHTCASNWKPLGLTKGFQRQCADYFQKHGRP